MIRELKTLVAVAREGTFAAAGDKVGLTQAAVSAQMQRLEAELGFAIFDRDGRAARLNARGHLTLAQGQEMIRLYNELCSQRFGRPATELINIGAIASVQRSALPDALARFHKRWPDCRTRVVPGLSMELVNLVDAGKIDLAVIIRPPFSLQSDLRWTTLVSEPFRLIVPRAIQSNDWTDLLSSQRFVRYDRTSFGGRQVDRFLREKHFNVHEVCEVDELEAIVRLVAQGVGIALVPETASLRRWPAAVRAINLESETFHRDIGLVHRASRTLSEPVRSMLDMFKSEYGNTSTKNVVA
ncbi:LysR family transcriptional regulator [Acidovorax sp. Root275]|uniref:LysR family transcriptional regulator n=1 Tax=Acidovorax sp. Root275 TaxID=1736508 RepID=UPI00070CA163|nr:LysR family transcriptional regulator [Acidovorax sp. Root275]KRD47876.1 LysR family transcriptional regulator [Acidovorax sp. Root275]